MLLIPIWIYVFYFPNIDISHSKFGRVTVLSGGLKTQSTDRYYSFLYMWEVFKTSPVFGKGVGYRTVTLRDEFFNKHPEAKEYRSNIQGMIMSGGHGSYVSILTTFGIGGIFWLLTMLFGSIYYAYEIFKKNHFRDDSKLALFAFIFLVILSVHMTIGGAGFDVSALWFLAGMIAGLKVRAEEKGLEVVEEEKEEYSGERLLWAEE